MPEAAIQQHQMTPAEFTQYDASQLLQSAIRVTPIQQSHRPVVQETAAEQDALV